MVSPSRPLWSWSGACIPLPEGVRAPGRSFFLLSLLVLLLLGLPSRLEAGSGSGGEVDEYDVKAAVLARFVNYTKWPARCFEKASSPIEVLVVGDQRGLKKIEKVLESSKIQGRAVVVTRVDTLPSSFTAHVLVADGQSKSQRGKILKACAKQPILLLGDSLEYTLEGGTMNFYIDGRKVKFAANLEALREAELAVSTNVLKLAKKVKTERGQ